jgi:antirestriction protein ArdC
MATTKNTKRRMTKEERQQARETAQAKAQAALDRLGEGVRAVYDSERWETWLQSLARFHDYSLNNTLLIAMQMPEATQVASFRSWKRDFNRHVRRGERGIEILVPMLVKCHAEEKEQDAGEERRRLVGFRVGHVFDVSQTEGEPLPTLMDEVTESVDRYAATLDAVRAVVAYPVEFRDDLPESTNGYFRRGELIAIREDMPEGQTVKTALHELAHSRLHDGDPASEGMPDRAMREVQAESVAYTVSAALGLDTSGYSFGYVASWAVGRTDKEMRACLQVVRDAAKAMVEDLQEAMAA